MYHHRIGKMNNYIECAYKVAEKSTHPKFKLGCVIIRGGVVISTAHNLWRFGRCCERRALKPHLDLRGGILIVVRSNKRISKPCLLCRKAIEEAGIKKIIYINIDGNIVSEKIGRGK